MTSFERRDPQSDNLLTPETSAFLIIDYQPTQINSINSIPHFELVQRISAVTKLMKDFEVPIILSTVNVATGRNKDTIPQLKRIVGDIPSYDRTTINAWEDKEFQAAVKSVNRPNLIIAALWTEACLTFPTIDALAEGYKVFPVVDAVGGTSTVAHEAALRRVEQAGATPVSYAQLACEFQRDWNRSDTVNTFFNDLDQAGIFLEL